MVSCKDRNPKTNNFSEAQNTLSTAQTIANKHGLEAFKQLDQIDFTFNVDRGENHFERSWQWRPKKNEVTAITAKDTITYNRATMDSTLIRYDSAFINYKYWLLAPFNLAWDEHLSFSKTYREKAPISGKEENVLSITYGDVGGYTPGDAYDLYYGDDYLLKEWIFRKGNDSLPSMTTTWEDYKEYNGVKIATMHRDSVGAFKLYFTDIKVN